MKKILPDGVWPVMLTLFTDEDQVDYPAMGRLVDWYIENGASGLFAVCQSSEMTRLSLDERVELARFVKQHANGRVPVVSSGHISDSLQGQIEEAQAIAATGIDAFVLVASRVCPQGESEETWKQLVTQILDAVPDVDFGLYECPAPYHRLLSPEAIGWCAATDRFTFMKETSSNPAQDIAKVQAAKGSRLKIYNTNGNSLLSTLRGGGSGYCGIMGNFHPDLYAWMCSNWQEHPQMAELLQTILGPLVLFEGRLYPTSAKYLLQLEGLGNSLHSRVRPSDDMTYRNRLEIAQLRGLCDYARAVLRGDTTNIPAVALPSLAESALA